MHFARMYMYLRMYKRTHVYMYVCMYVYVSYCVIVMCIGVAIKDHQQSIRLLQFCMNLPCMEYINRPDMSHTGLCICRASWS